jgi:hypothetical protein
MPAASPPPNFKRSTAAACPSHSKKLLPETTPRQRSHRNPPIPSSSAGSYPPPARDPVFRDRVSWSAAALLTVGVESDSLNKRDSAVTVLLVRGIGHHFIKVSSFLNFLRSVHLWHFSQWYDDHLARSVSGIFTMIGHHFLKVIGY